MLVEVIKDEVQKVVVGKNEKKFFEKLEQIEKELAQLQEENNVKVEFYCSGDKWSFHYNGEEFEDVRVEGNSDNEKELIYDRMLWFIDSVSATDITEGDDPSPNSYDGYFNVYITKK